MSKMYKAREKSKTQDRCPFAKKHCLTKQTYGSFKMNKEELVRDMHLCLNLIVNELNSIGLTKLEDGGHCMEDHLGATTWQICTNCDNAP